MEIFNSIWTALSTPNEGLLNILLIPANIIETVITMYLFLNVIKLNSTTIQKIVYVICICIISKFTMLLVPSPFNIFVNYIFIILLAYIIFKNPFLKTSASVVISLIISNLVGGLILNPFITLFNITTEQLNSIPLYRLSYMFSMLFILYLIILILNNPKLKLEFLENIDKKSKNIIIINLILGIITIIVQSITLFYYVDNLPVIITFLSSLSLLAYFAISIYSLTRIFKLISTTQKLESAEEYNNTLRILHDNVRGFKHDFDNIVTTIGGYIKTEDMEGLRNYYLQLEDDCQRVNNLYILNPEVVNNDGIYNLLTKKYYEAESKDIKVNITFLLDLSTLNMKIYEFARILGILLDNAIEASSECEEKIINIVFRNDPNNFRQLVLIENTFNDKNLDTDKIFEKGVSGKENHTGLGLWEVRKLIKKNNNINLYTSKSDKYFSQQLEIYYK